MTTHESGERRTARVSRRAMLRLLGGAGAAAPTAPVVTSAPGGAAAPTATTARPAETMTRPPATITTGAASAPAASPPAADGTIRIPTTGAKLPTERVTFRWLDTGGVKGIFFKQYFAAYQQAHPNITVQYDELPVQESREVVSLGIRNNNAPDIFRLPAVTPGQAIKENWVTPLDDIVPDFAQWKAAFPAGSFFPGVTTFNDKTYTFPLFSNRAYGTLLLYNVPYLQQAGYDPSAKPLTWDEFRAAARKLTEQGKGQYYGLIIGGKQVGEWGGFAGNLAKMAGAPGSDFMNWQTGEYAVATDPYLAAIDLLLTLKADGSIFPGSLSLNAAEARATLPRGGSAMILQGVHNIPLWKEEKPDFHFAVASQPVPNTGSPMPLGYGPGSIGPYFVYSKSPYKTIAGDMFAYLGSEEGMTAMQASTEGTNPVTFPRANQVANLDPRTRKVHQLFESQMRLNPDPVVRNPDVEEVYQELKKLTPDFPETIQGIFSGQIRDPKRAMQDLAERMEKELERAIKAAQGKGAKVSRDDWVFPNWDPARDYTEADYAALRP